MWFKQSRRLNERYVTLCPCTTSSFIMLCWLGVESFEWGVSPGGVLSISPWFKITRSVPNSPRIALECGINEHSFHVERLVPDFSPYVNPSRVSVQTESRLIMEKKPTAP
ncbi:hypothetical protein TNCV_4995551 [Trichonephila clavipes]|nr:hypothetical protein TNCV_4995551 [Trichonephila clavipes]